MTSLSLLVAQVGIRRLVNALGGAEDVGGLAASMLGILAQVEASQSRLLAIEQKLDTLLEQRYTAGLGVGTRLLQQALLEGRSQESRREDLQRADAALVDASHSANTAMQRALVERLLFLVRMGLGDAVIARDSWRRLDVHTGDALAAAHARYEWPFDEARPRMEKGEFGALSAWDKLRAPTPDPRWHKAHGTVKSEARASIEDLATLLGDAMAAARLIGADQGMPTGIPVAAPGRIVIDAPLQTEVRVAGLVATVGGVGAVTTRPNDRSGYRSHQVSALIELSSERSAAVQGWVAGGVGLAHETASSPSSDLRHGVTPGQRTELTAEIYRAPDFPLRRVILVAGGLVLSAPLPDQR